MSSEAEMRQVMLHAADKLHVALDCTTLCARNHNAQSAQEYALPREATVAVAYAEALLRTVASYLTVTDPPSSLTPGEGK